MSMYPRGKERPCPEQLPGCTGKIRDRSSKMCARCAITKRQIPHADLPPIEHIAHDREKQRSIAELTSLRHRYDESLKIIERLEYELQATTALGQGIDTYAISPQHGSHTSEGTVILVASDWHVEETVGPEVGGLNVYNLDIAKLRATTFFQAGLRLVNLLHQDINITTIVLALLGDFISNDIHEEFTDITEQQPIHAIVTAQNFLISGIEFLLANSTAQLVIPCHSGNHARTTKTTRFAAENGHSLEYLMYLHLAAYFREQPRVQFIIPEGYHSYLDVYETTIRFHHGHAIRYAGGVGGITIPVNKAIAQWQKARHADLDVFGHFHQMLDGGNFVANGSLIGYNAFALSIKASYEPPRQTLFLMDKKRAKTAVWPILVGGVPQ